ncbi:MAG: CBS domain-containing protein [Deltaproteobacteria bacterium]
MAKTAPQKNQRTSEASSAPEAVITTHINADFDALSSMLAASKLYPDAALVFPGSQEKNLRDFFLHSTSYLFNFTRLKHIDLDQIKQLILVDTRQKGRIGEFAQLADKKGVEIHIYDHHPDSSDDVKGTLEMVEKIGSATALLTRLIRERGIPISADEATIMCLGIHEDTGSFTFSSTTSQDYEAAGWLTKQGANHNIISDMITRELTAEQVWLLNDLTRAATTRVINGVEVVTSKVIRDEYIGDFAVLVHKFMEMENLDVVFALAQMEDRIYLVARSRTDEVNAAEIALALGGGGHPQAASATIKNKTLIQVERSLNALLNSRVSPARRARHMMSSPVIHISSKASVSEASQLLTRFNINVLLVVDHDVLLGYVTRQIVEKAIFLGLGDLKIKEYMNIEFDSVGPDATLKEVQDHIIKDRLRVLPVMENGKVLGVITRTDLLNILVGEPVIPEVLYQSKNASQFLRKKRMAGIIKERLPRKVITLLKNIGNVADTLGFNAYIVGGLVRDIFLREDNLDMDVVIEGDGIEFAHAFAEKYDVRVKSHRKFGTAVLIFPDDVKVDVATARMEYYESPGAPPIVETSSLKLDLYRRDFTINTLAIKLNKRHYGTLIDYFGGQKDIKEKVIRVLHNLSFVEDPTRMLRAVRFEQRFGFTIGKLTLALIKNAAKMDWFESLASRRIFQELRLLLKENNPVDAIRRMDELGLLALISPQLQLTEPLVELLEEIERVIAWYQLLFLEEPLVQWKPYWYGLTSTLNHARYEQLAPMMDLKEPVDEKGWNQRDKGKGLLNALYKFEGANYELYTLLRPYDTEMLLYLMAKSDSDKVKRYISNYFTRLKGTEVILKGEDLIQMGFAPGPLFKEVFDRLLEARLNHETKNRADEIRLVKKVFADRLPKRRNNGRKVKGDMK